MSIYGPSPIFRFRFWLATALQALADRVHPGYAVWVVRP